MDRGRHGSGGVRISYASRFPAPPAFYGPISLNDGHPFGRCDTFGMKLDPADELPPRRPRPPVVPAHYRLSKESWAEIVEAYRNGATARALAVKWKVAPGSVYYHACREGWGKKTNGDDRARAHAQAVEAAEAVQTEPLRAEQKVLKSLFAPGKANDPDAGDPAALATLATLASGRAMTGRLWSEARALAGLAESYARLGERAAGARGGGGSIATIDLGLLREIIVDPDGAVTQRFARKDEGANDPDAALKAHYWDYQAARHRAVGNNTRELMMRAVYAEKRLGELGHPARVNVTDVEIEAWVRDWLSAPPSEANLARRTKIGEWPWR